MEQHKSEMTQDEWPGQEIGGGIAAIQIEIAKDELRSNSGEERRPSMLHDLRPKKIAYFKAR